MESDRLRLAYARAAYQAEIERLGLLAHLLLTRPLDLPETRLLTALQETEINRKIDKVKTTPIDQGETEEVPVKQESWWRSWFQQKLHRGDSTPTTLDPASEASPREEHSWKHRMQRSYSQLRRKLPSFSDYYIQWVTDGASNFFSIRKLESNGEIYGPAANRALFTEDESWDTDGWLDQASDWTTKCRSAICRILYESLQGSSSGSGIHEADFLELQRAWVHGLVRRDYDVFLGEDVENEMVQRKSESILRDWSRVVEYVVYLPHWRRLGEGQTLRLRDAAIVSWTRRLNVLGLPLALLQILLANALHEFVKPYWPQLKQETVQAYLKLLEIIHQRVWVPLEGIYDEIMNRSPGLMTGFGLQLEERSLDHMLRDLGYGDGTPESRASALERAATQYELDLNQGLFMNFASGRLVRLLLVQVQQLKVGLLQALDTIDVLIKVRYHLVVRNSGLIRMCLSCTTHPLRVSPAL